MNIEPAIITATKPVESQTNSSSSTAVSEEAKSFKAELENTKAKEMEVTKKEAASKDVANTQSKPPIKPGAETFKEQVAKNIQLKEIESMNAAEANQNLESQNSLSSQQLLAQKNARNVQLQQMSKDNMLKADESTSEFNLGAEGADPLNELSSKIAALSSLKNNFSSKTHIKKAETVDKGAKSDYCQTIKMNPNDITFFLNLVDNQQLTAQNSMGVNSQNGAFTDIKSEATQQTVPVSAPLMDALNESFKTNKPFRIDFGGDVAVIMKVDRDGKLSANFIPGSAAVEAYLKNNIALLQQSFDEQNLPYNQLSYSKQQQQQQKENKKENNDE